MSNSKNKTRYNVQYAKQNLKRIPLDVQKEKYKEIKNAAKFMNKSVNGYIKQAIHDYPDHLKIFNFTFDLGEDITFNDNIFFELENLLMKHSDQLIGFTREGSTEGEYKLTLRFRTEKDFSIEIINEFKNILLSHKISFKWSDIFVAGEEVAKAK